MREIREGVFEIYWRERRGGPLRFRRVHGDREAAQRKLEIELGRRHTRPQLAEENVRFGDYALEWIAEREGSMRYSTWEMWRDTVNVHLMPAFENDKITQITARHLRRYVAGKLTGNPQIPTRNRHGHEEPAGRTLSPQTVRHHLGLLNQIFKQALADDVAHRNPVSGVPKPRVERDSINPLRPEEVTATLAQVADHADRTLLLLLVSTGLRVGEALALEWVDYDERRRRLYVRHAVVRTKRGFAKGRPKTKNSLRDFMIGEALHSELMRLRSNQSDAPNPHNLIFPTPDGGYRAVSQVRKRVFFPAIGTVRIQALRDQQFELFFTHVPEEFQLAVRLTRLPGIGAEDVLSLRRSDLNVTTGEVTYRTPMGDRRTHTLDPETRDELARYIEATADRVDKRGVLLINSRGGPLNAHRFADLVLFRALRDSGVAPVMRVHDLRHTFASAAIRAGTNPKRLSRILGHSSVAFTLSTYTHFFEDDWDEPVDTADLYTGTSAAAAAATRSHRAW